MNETRTLFDYETMEFRKEMSKEFIDAYRAVYKGIDKNAIWITPFPNRAERRQTKRLLGLL